MEKIIPEPVAKQVREAFAGLTGPVEVLFFGKESGCPVCSDTRQLLDEVTGLSDLLSLQEYDIERDAEFAGQYGITETPAFLLVSRVGETIKDYGVRFLGIPAGHEFSSLIHGLLLVSKGDSGLAQPTREFLSGLSQPVLLQVFTTPTWPYCPRAVVLAHQMAVESDLVQAEMVDAMEFGELSDRYQVSGVPQTTINAGLAHVVGAVPEEQLVDQIRRALVSVQVDER